MTITFNWSALVNEAIRRRKAEGFTQKQLAALADVSVPTVISFEKGDESLNLANATKILNVLGLIDQKLKRTPQDIFIAEAFARWSKLVEPLPSDHPSRFPRGYAAYDYELIGNIRSSSISSFRNDILEKSVTRYSGWPPFWIPSRDGIRPYVVDDLVECWLGDPAVGRAFVDSAHADFWRISPKGRAYLQRGYQEDGEDLPNPGTIFDLTLPIWRAAEVILHARNLAANLIVGSNASIELRIRYTGLLGRELTSWARRERYPLFGVHRSRTEEVSVSVTADTKDLEKNLTQILVELLHPLYERFDFFELSEGLVQEETQQLLSKRF